jgi:glycosyltransferase involved in cell wall biosynthesis
MNKRPRISIVVGELLQPRILGMFEALAEAFDICIYALDSEGLIDSHGTGLKLRLFENIEDMPGYMRGVEDELAGSAAIIAFETSRLSTFQAVRAARKYNIPLGVMATEYRPFFYDSFQNIRAIQFDICNKADMFWPTSNQAADNLRLDHVPEEAIKVINPVIDSTKFHVSPEGRLRFREYIKLSPADFVVLFYGDLETFNRPLDVLNSMSLLSREMGKDADHVKLIFAGNGSAAMDLKYRSFDKGLGSKVMFLHQAPDPFLADLYNACDAIIAPKPDKTEFHEDLPLSVMEAMACGAIPIVTAGSVAHELAGSACVSITDNSFQSMFVGLKKLVSSRGEVTRLTEAVEVHAKEQFSRKVSGENFIGDVWTLIEESKERREEMFCIDDFTERVANWIQEGNETEALHAIEDALLNHEDSLQLKSELNQLKGDVKFAQGELDGATESYTVSVQIDNSKYKSFRGLGYVAWQSHANEDSLVFFRRALALKEDDQTTILGIGLVYRRLGLLEEALFWLEKAVGPGDSTRAIVALSQACLECSRPQSGIDVIERVIEVAGEKTPLLMSLGQLHINNGNAITGRKFLEKAMGS